jgi:hypothetical protein
MVRHIRRNKLRALNPRKGSIFHVHIPAFRDPIVKKIRGVNRLVNHPMGYCNFCGRAMQHAKPKPTALAVAQ